MANRASKSKSEATNLFLNIARISGNHVTVTLMDGVFHAHVAASSLDRQPSPEADALEPLPDVMSRRRRPDIVHCKGRTAETALGKLVSRYGRIMLNPARSG